MVKAGEIYLVAPEKILLRLYKQTTHGVFLTPIFYSEPDNRYLCVQQDTQGIKTTTWRTADFLLSLEDCGWDEEIKQPLMAAVSHVSFEPRPKSNYHELYPERAERLTPEKFFQAPPEITSVPKEQLTAPLSSRLSSKQYPD